MDNRNHYHAAPPLVDWRTPDGTEPDLSCYACGRRTPMLIHGLGFDCCAPANDDATHRESMPPTILAIVLGLALGFWVVAIIGAVKAWPWISATVAGWFA